MQPSHLLTDVARVILAITKIVPGVSWGLWSVHPEALKEGVLRSQNNTRHTLSLPKQGSVSQTSSRATGPIQVDHCRSVPTLQADGHLLTRATAEQCSRLALTAAATLTWLEMLYLPT